MTTTVSTSALRIFGDFLHDILATVALGTNLDNKLGTDWPIPLRQWTAWNSLITVERDIRSSDGVGISMCHHDRIATDDPTQSLLINEMSQQRCDTDDVITVRSERTVRLDDPSTHELS